MTTLVPYIPDSAPFNSAQRAWLNGFFAGVFSSGGSTNVASAAALVPTTEPVVIEEDFPWHDAALSLDERLQLAETKPIERRFMAAMAQLDCGACGYVCQTYGEAIARGEETDLTRCSPGGADTAKMLKQLVALNVSSPAAPRINGHAQPAATANEKPKYDRNRPFTAKIIEVQRLTHEDAPKDTRHVAIDLGESGLSYEPGDALGICATNCPDLVATVIKFLGAQGDEPVAVPSGGKKPLREALSTDFALNRARPDLFDLLAELVTNPSQRADLQVDRDTDPFFASADVADSLERFAPCTLPLDRFIATLGKLQPRLYSISSSPRAVPGQVHLTVGVVRYEAQGRWKNGVASHFLGVRSNAGDPVRVFVQPSKFRLPEDPATPIIMVGPGTGIAPFRGFMQEREATGSTGPAWLFFGNQYIEFDFLYRKELTSYLNRGVLSRLDLAFSRDTADKVYVQTRMRENAAELWKWLEDGAHFYVCGDAKRMAPDVEQALLQAIAEFGHRSAEEAKAYLTSMVKAKRYHKDVY